MSFTFSAPIETERLILRGIEPDDLPAVHAYERLDEVARYLYWGPRSEDQSRDSVARKARSRTIANEGDFLALGVVRRDRGELIGDVVLGLASAEHRQGEIGFVIDPAHGGRGYATEAAAPLLAIAFDALDLHRVVGRTEARNIASARVLEKLGMRCEAHLRENEFVKGEWQSELVYAILADEWRSAADA